MGVNHKLYETDFVQWATTQADHLRQGEYGELDIPNLIDEIEGLAAWDRRELKRALVRIIEHMLKLTCDPKSRVRRSWRQAIIVQRIEIELVLDDNATLRVTADQFVPFAYKSALRLIGEPTKCKVEDFPEHCPWTSSQLLDPNFWP